jgi:hypothetical protein
MNVEKIVKINCGLINFEDGSVSVHDFKRSEQDVAEWRTQSKNFFGRVASFHTDIVVTIGDTFSTITANEKTYVHPFAGQEFSYNFKRPRKMGIMPLDHLSKTFLSHVSIDSIPTKIVEQKALFGLYLYNVEGIELKPYRADKIKAIKETLTCGIIINE